MVAQQVSVAPEVAKKEVFEWMDWMETPVKARDNEFVTPFVDSLIDSVSKGYLVINEDKSITQNLKVPLADGHTKTIKYDFRFTIGEYHDRLKGVDLDETATVLAKLQLISKSAPELLRRLDRRDFNVAKALAVFF